MASVRRAFAWATLGQYVVTAITLGGTVVLARLLSPADYGVAIIGATVIGLAEAVRALGGGTYLIQHLDLTPTAIRASFTVNAVVSIVLAAMLAGLGNPLSRVAGMPGLGSYLQVAVIGYLAGPFTQPIMALLSRRMAFATLARAAVLAAVVDTGTAIVLARLGHGTMSLAWADALAPLAAMLLYLNAWRDWSIFRPALSGWCGAVTFGAYDGAIGILTRLGELLPYFVLGRILNPAAVGICQRALLLCLVPERIILAGVGAVALSSFAQKAREGRPLKDDYLRAVELLTAVQWPCLICLALLADPIVAVLLGRHWTQTGPLVAIIATALLFSFPVSMSYATLVAAGAIRRIPPILLLQVVVATSAVALTAPGGLRSAVLSLLFALPFNSVASMMLVKRVIDFRWGEFAAAVRRSAGCAALSALGPVAARLAIGRHAEMTVDVGVLAATLSAGGWSAGLWVFRHPLLREASRALDALRRLA